MECSKSRKLHDIAVSLQIELDDYLSINKQPMLSFLFHAKFLHACLAWPRENFYILKQDDRIIEIEN